MTDLAELGLVVKTNAGQAVKELDGLTGAAGRAERAGEGLTGSSRRTGSAIAEMMASIERTVRAMEAHMRAASGVAAAQDRGTAATQRATNAAREAYTVHARYATSYQQVANAANAAAPAIKRAGDEAAKAGNNAKAAAASWDTLYDDFQRDFVGQYVAGINKANTVTKEASKQHRILTMTGLNLSRQFADIGVTAAMGMNPLMILIQQGPQIADSLAVARAQGLGLSQVLGGMASGAVGATVALAPLVALAGGLAVGFGLMYRQLSKEFPKDVTKGLNLTEEQLERVKDKTVTMGDVFKSTLNVMGKYLMSGPLGDAIGWLGKKWNELLDFMTKVAFEGTAIIVGSFIGAYRTVVSNWQSFPAVLGDLFAMAANKSLEGIEKLLNGTIAGLNKLKRAVGIFNPLVGILPDIPEADLSKFKMGISGAAQFAGNALKSNIGQAINDVRGGLRKLGAEISAGALKGAQDRALKQAGKPNKDGKSGSDKDKAEQRDTYAENLARVEQALASAMSSELQARMALTKDIVQRAAIEKEMLRSEAAEKEAQVQRSRAQLEDDKGISDEQRKQLEAMYELVSILNDRTATLRQQAIDEELKRQQAAQAAAIEAGNIGIQIDLLQSQQGLAKFEYQRRKISKEILALQQQIERIKLQEVIDTTDSASAEHKIAVARMRLLDIIQKNERDAQDGGFDGAYGRAMNAFSSVARAWKSKDWNGLVNGLQESIGQLKEAFGKAGTMAGKIGAAAGLAQVVGGAVGGTAGSVIGGAGAGAAMGFQLGGPIGAGIGAVVGGIGGLLGSNKAKREARQAAQAQRAQLEAERLARIENERRSQEIELLNLQGKSLEAVALQRKYELEAMDASNRARQQQIWALEDQKKREETYRSLEVQLLEATGQSMAALNVQRAEELKSIEEAMRPFQQAIWALKDAQDAAAKSAEEWADKVANAQSAVDDARAVAVESYNREAGAIQATISRMQGMIQQLDRFRDELLLNTAPGSSRYDVARAQFRQTAAAAASGDETAMGNLQSSVNSFIEASRTFSPTSGAMARDRAEALRAVSAAQAAAKKQLDKAEQQLVVLNRMVEGLGIVNSSVVSVEAAVSNLQFALGSLAAVQAQAQASADANAQAIKAAIEAATAAQIAAQQAAQLPANQNVQASFDAAGYLAKNPDVAAEYARHTSTSDINYLNSLGISSAEAYATWHWDKYGQKEGRSFKTGGGFQVGGSGGHDSQFMPMWLTPGETVNVSRSDSMSAVVAELRAVRMELAELKKPLEKTADNTKDTKDTLNRVTQGTDTLMTQAA